VPRGCPFRTALAVASKAALAIKPDFAPTSRELARFKVLARSARA
jgi:hypothetical protein